MHKNKITQLLACLTLSLSASVTHAAVSGAEAQVLKSALTPLGAERAGNADGSIPAWTGGYTQVPAGFQEGHRAFDPFKDDKPLYSVTAANMSQYADKLTDGVKQPLKHNPQTFKLAAYPTRRTAAATQWV